MVDAIDLIFSEDPRNLTIEFMCCIKIVSKRLLDNNTCPTLTIPVQTRIAKILNNLRILTGRCRQVENTISTGTTFLIKFVQERIELGVAFWIMKIGLQIVESSYKAIPHLLID